MEEALLHEVFGVDKTYRSKGTEIKHGGVFVALEPVESLLVCPQCQSREVIRKGKRTRRIQSLPIGFHPVYFEVEVPRCQCKGCAHVFEIAPLLPGLRALHANLEPLCLRFEPGHDDE
ncbi:MAG TPA: transposase family protein [Verrucomicrobiae bacterium]|nr:transposase family protein [Verrucomicrobiae bacterium]